MYSGAWRRRPSRTANAGRLETPETADGHANSPVDASVKWTERHSQSAALDGNHATELLIERFENHSHPAAADKLHDLVMIEAVKRVWILRRRQVMADIVVGVACTVLG